MKRYSWGWFDGQWHIGEYEPLIALTVSNHLLKHKVMCGKTPERGAYLHWRKAIPPVGSYDEICQACVEAMPEGIEK